MRVKESIYLDYQASTPTDARVVEAMLPYFTESFANPHSANHALGWSAAAAIEVARAQVASLIGALEEEVVFTSGATEANNQAIFSVIAANKTQRKTILISSIEHKCVKEAAFFYGSRFGYFVRELPVHASGEIDRNIYCSMLTEDVLLVSIMAVNNEIGAIQDISWLAAQAKAVGALFHCDAAQAPEAIAIDVCELGVDLLSLSAHKMYGPKGIGALFVDSALISASYPLIHGGGQQNGLRSGTLPTPLCVGFGVAAEIELAEGAFHRKRMAFLSQTFMRCLENAGIKFVLNGQAAERHPGNLNLRFPGVEAESLLNALQPAICASTGSACNSGFIESSYVLSALGLSSDEAASSIRFSVGRFSDENQVAEAASLIALKVAEFAQ